MSMFSVEALLKKLADLNGSQQSIQTVSLWVIHHRRHYSNIVKAWAKEVQKANEAKKLVLIYFANDVIQNSRKKGPEYNKEFAQVLPKTFTHIGNTCHSEKLLSSIGRVLNIWEQRGVYDAKTIQEYRARLNKEQVADKADEPRATANIKEYKPEKVDGHKHKHKKSRESKQTRTAAAAASEGDDTPSNGASAEINLLTSPHIPLGEPPEPEELIRHINKVDNTASSDAVVRERIAKLPAHISERPYVEKLTDKEQALVYQKQVEEASELLENYNSRLGQEMEDRNKLMQMLRNYLAEQEELTAQAEARMEEYKKKLANLMIIRKTIKDHLTNLPDLSQLPDVTAGLAPLPSAGDLFKNH